MGTLTRENILSAKRPSILHPMPALGGDVWITSMESPDKDAFERSNAELAEASGTSYGYYDNIRSRLLVRSITDENGVRLLADDDAIALGKAWNPNFEEAFALAKKVNGWSNEDLEEIAKNSKADLKESSGTT